MTKKIAISIPDDVAERLAAGDIVNVSAYVTEALRRRIVFERTRDFHRQRGMDVTEEGVERWRTLLAERDAAIGDEDRWNVLDQRLRELREGKG
jgi:hypothetical protein